jgi:C_GCAxxG_C_C family probable redox protein
MMQLRVEMARESFLNGFNCAQAVFMTYAGDFGVSEEIAKRIACGFGAGMGRLQETCGAVSGAFMLIGCKYGKVLHEDNAATENTYELVREFVRRFNAKHGTISCRELLGCDLQTEEGKAYFKEQGFRELRCAQYVHDAAELVEEMLEL